jgi:hypothetical protein
VLEVLVVLVDVDVVVGGLVVVLVLLDELLVDVVGGTAVVLVVDDVDDVVDVDDVDDVDDVELVEVLVDVVPGPLFVVVVGATVVVVEVHGGGL